MYATTEPVAVTTSLEDAVWDISTMTDLIGELRSRRLVRELDPIRRPGAGRPTRPIAFDGEPWCVLGVHVNLDKVELRREHRRWSRAVDRDRARRPAGHRARGLRPARRAAPRPAAAHRRTTSSWSRIEIGARRRRSPPTGRRCCDYDNVRLAGLRPGRRDHGDPAGRSASTTPRSASATSASWRRLYADPGRAAAARRRHRGLPRRHPDDRRRADHPRRDLPRRRRRCRSVRTPEHRRVGTRRAGAAGPAAWSRWPVRPRC